MKFSTAIVCAVALAAMSANAAPIQSVAGGLSSNVPVTSSSGSHHHRHSTEGSSLSGQTNGVSSNGVSSNGASGNGASGSRIHYGSVDNRQQSQTSLNNANLDMGGLNALLSSQGTDNTMQYPNADLQGVVPQPEQLRQNNNQQYASAIKAQTRSLNLNAAQASTVSQVLQRLTGSGSQAVETGAARSRHQSSATSSSKKHHKHSASSSSSKHRKSKHHKSKHHKSKQSKSSSSTSSATDSSSSSTDASATPTDTSTAAPDATPTDAASDAPDAPDAPDDAAATPMAADPAAAADPPPPSDSGAPPPQKRSVGGENVSAVTESLRRCRRPSSLSGSRSASHSARPTNSHSLKHGHLNGQSSTGDVEIRQAFGFDGTHSMSTDVNVGGSGASSVGSASRSRPQGTHTRLHAAAQSSSAAPSADVGAGLWGLIFGN